MITVKYIDLISYLIVSQVAELVEGLLHRGEARVAADAVGGALGGERGHGAQAVPRLRRPPGLRLLLELLQPVLDLGELLGAVAVVAAGARLLAIALLAPASSASLASV